MGEVLFGAFLIGAGAFLGFGLGSEVSTRSLCAAMFQQPYEQMAVDNNRCILKTETVLELKP